MKKLIIYQIDSFTTEKFKGNPAGVVINADGLSSSEMQQIAKELNNSETGFWHQSTDTDYDAEIRYFTPTTEVPICGHATIACMYAKALEENLNSCTLNIKTGVGILPFEIIKTRNDVQIVMTQGEFQCSSELKQEDINSLLTALGMSHSDLDLRCPIQIASAGHSKVMIGLKHKQTLDQLTPNFSQLTQLSERINCMGYFVFTLDSNNKDVLTFGRMFAPAIGINEDPVTGNANGPLGGYLVKNNLLKSNDGYIEFNAQQGEAMGRLGTVKVIVQTLKDEPSIIKIKGQAVVIFKTKISI